MSTCVEITVDELKAALSSDIRTSGTLPEDFKLDELSVEVLDALKAEYLDLKLNQNDTFAPLGTLLRKFASKWNDELLGKNEEPEDPEDPEDPGDGPTFSPVVLQALTYPGNSTLVLLNKYFVRNMMESAGTEVCDQLHILLNGHVYDPGSILDAEWDNSWVTVVEPVPSEVTSSMQRSLGVGVYLNNNPVAVRRVHFELTGDGTVLTTTITSTEDFGFPFDTSSVSPDDQLDIRFDMDLLSHAPHSIRIQGEEPSMDNSPRISGTKHLLDTPSNREWLAPFCAELPEGEGDEEEFSTSSQTFNTTVQVITPQNLRNSVEDMTESFEEPLCDMLDMILGGADTQLMDIGSVITASSYANVPLATEAPEGGTWDGGYIVGAAIMDSSQEPPAVVAQSRAIGSLYIVDGEQVAVISNTVHEGFPYTVTHDRIQTALNHGDPALNAAAGITETSLTVSKVFDDRDAVLASIFPECSL